MSPEIEIVTKATKRGNVKSKPKSRTKSLSKYKRELDAIFGRYIRNRDNHTCYTCNLVMDPKKSQNGHFVPRQYLAVRWDEVNCHAQCYACNVLYNGQPSDYAASLKRDFGPDIVEILEGKRKIITKLKPDFYEYWIKIYTEKLMDFSL